LDEKTRSIFSASPDAIAIIDSNGTIVECNQAALDMFKYASKEEITSKNAFDSIAKRDQQKAKENMKKTMRQGSIKNVEYTFLTKDGREFPAELSAHAMRGHLGASTTLVAIIKDISERKQAQETLNESEKRYRGVIDNIGVGVAVISPKMEILGLNKQTQKWFPHIDVSKKPICYTAFNNPPRENICTYCPTCKTLKDGQVHESTTETPSGKKTINYRVISTALFDDKNEIVAAIEVVDDVTKQKQMEKKIKRYSKHLERLVEERTRRLRKSEEHFRSVADYASEAIITIDAHNAIVFWNKAAENLFGYSSNEAIGKPITIVMSEWARENHQKAMKRMVAAGMTESIGKPFEFTGMKRDGTEFPVELSFSVWKTANKTFFTGMMRDITDRKRTEMELRDSEEKYRNVSKKLASLMRSSAVMLHTTDQRQRLKTIAEAVREQGWGRVVISLRDEELNTIDVVTAGLTAEEEEYLKEHQSPGQVWRKRLSSMFEQYRLGEFYYLPWSDPLVQDQFKYALASNVAKEETVGWNPDDLLFVPLKLPSGQIVGIMSMDDPADGRCPTVESLAPLELFAHQAAVAIENAKLIQQVKEYAQDLEQKVEDRTAELRRSEEKLKGMFSASPDAITATDMNGYIVECNEQTLKMHGYTSRKELIDKSAFEFIKEKDRQKAMENLKKTFEQGSTKNAEYTMLRKDGSEFPAELSASIVRDASGNPTGFVAVTKDITERKRMEQQLFKSERLAAIGELAGMIGHDLRNPLTGIAGATYYLKTRSGLKMDAKAIEMLKIIGKDIEYSNKIINDLLEYSREMKLDLTESTPRNATNKALSSLKIPKRIQVLNMTQNKPVLEVDAEKLRRVFINIIRNAIDAMPKCGTLTIRSKRTKDDVAISFSDTGVGMSKENMGRIWTPLFTTKAKGMGFGLAICKRIAEAHEGKISVESALSKGSIFTVTIPLKPKTEEREQLWVNVPESLLPITMNQERHKRTSV
jgi:PAS domain S-box-containing protein